MPSTAIDSGRDSFVLADLRHLERLGALTNPSAESLRPFAEAVRRLLLGGALAASAAAQGIELALRVPDSLPLVRDARNGHIQLFNLAGLRVAGVPMSATWLANASWAAGDFDRNRFVALSPEAFLKQVVAFAEGELLSRQDVLTYVVTPEGVTGNRRRALGQLRRRMQLYIENGGAMVMFHPAGGPEEHATSYRYDREFLDVVFLEFVAAVQHVLASPQVQALRAAIEGQGRQAA